MKVALAQMDLKWLDIETNSSKIRHFVDQAEKERSDLVVFPEMALTGFCMEPEKACLKPDGPELQELIGFTRRKKVLVLLGAAIQRPQGFFNECLMIQNGVVLGSYAKMNLFTPSDEHLHYKPGATLMQFNTTQFNFIPLICFDLRFPRNFQKWAPTAPDAYIVMASWPQEQSTQWKTLLSARAIDTQSYLIGVNRIGSGGGMNFSGDCMVVAPSGKSLFEYNSSEKLLTAEIDPSYARKIKGRFPVLGQHEQEKKPVAFSTRDLNLLAHPPTTDIN